MWHFSIFKAAANCRISRKQNRRREKFEQKEKGEDLDSISHRVKSCVWRSATTTGLDSWRNPFTERGRAIRSKFFASFPGLLRRWPPEYVGSEDSFCSEIVASQTQHEQRPRWQDSWREGDDGIAPYNRMWSAGQTSPRTGGKARFYVARWLDFVYITCLLLFSDAIQYL